MTRAICVVTTPQSPIGGSDPETWSLRVALLLQLPVSVAAHLASSRTAGARIAAPLTRGAQNRAMLCGASGRTFPYRCHFVTEEDRALPARTMLHYIGAVARRPPCVKGLSALADWGIARASPSPLRPVYADMNTLCRKNGIRSSPTDRRG